VYNDYVINEGKHKILFVRMLRALYRMLLSSILYYKKFRKDIEAIGFKVNPYDICVANRTVNGKQQTLTWHVDDLKSSHVNPKVNDDFAEWCKITYGSDDLGHVLAVRGKIHDYLAMILDFTQDGALKIDMKYYIQGMLEEFPFEVTVDREAIQSLRRHQETWRRAAQHFSHVRDESNVYVQESTTRYRTSNLFSILKSQ
jgi:hypothetical protein